MTKHAFFLSIVLLATAPLHPEFATVALPDQPPVVVIYCATQGDPPCCGDHLKFDASVGNVDPNDKLRYVWSMTKGRIRSGQGTSSIEVDASDAKGQPILVTLEVVVTIQVNTRGRKRRYGGVASASYQTCPVPRHPTKACS